MKLWVDDEREAPSGWEHRKTVHEAIMTIDNLRNSITHISLDHDDGKDTFEAVARFIRLMKELHFEWDPHITVHSANPIGKKNMESILLNK